VFYKLLYCDKVFGLIKHSAGDDDWVSLYEQILGLLFVNALFIKINVGVTL
jgi:hypothetical protein